VEVSHTILKVVFSLPIISVRMSGIPDMELEEIIMSNAKHLTRDNRISIVSL
jgi:hypothetical protein